ncbi:hypothetical protein [Alkalihalobacillus sp. AL-G]|uniref:hypothetical protein n=1 Tax=Alkalihalobacillus sp. AL-G TaxID=2926399 RepID=UPI00272D398D|nr:hypothetical protein [Alkalihalobacillus sp. AL-G]WLD94043.1 hypothetical protein MOJ78_03855 [Alkalihalobacillus sp. AL-G]
MPDKGPQYEGRAEAYMDIDRMVNEGMAGGTVSGRYDQRQIEQSLELFEEAPPVELNEDGSPKKSGKQKQG